MLQRFAARLQSLAEPDTVIIDSNIHRLLGDETSGNTALDSRFEALRTLAKPTPARRILSRSRCEGGIRTVRAFTEVLADNQAWFVSSWPDALGSLCGREFMCVLLGSKPPGA